MGRVGPAAGRLPIDSGGFTDYAFIAKFTGSLECANGHGPAGPEMEKEG
jgi:hypothetical protein